MGRRKALDQKTLLSLEFQEYYAMIRKPYFVVGSVLLTLAWIASGAVMITLENEIATGIVSIVLGLGSFVVFMIGLKNRFLLYFDIIASASICLHYVIHLFDMFIHLLGNTSAHAFGHYVIPMTIFFAIFFSLRPQFALLCICACALLPALTTVSTTYPSQYDVHMVINNFILFGQYAFITVFALTYQQKLDIGRYVNQLKIHKTQRVLAEQREKSKDLLENLFPPVIREFVEQHRAENYPKATVVFADLENFAQLTAQLSPNESIDLLNQVFSYLDSLVTKYGLLKVKTTGEVYIAVANVPKESPTAAIDAIRFALDGVEGIRLLGATASMPIRPRFGVNTGFVVAGTMHTSKLTFDIYGDAVNLAHRMMHHGVPGAVQISIHTLRALPATVQQQVLPAIGTAEHSPWSSPGSPRSVWDQHTSDSDASQTPLLHTGQGHEGLCASWTVHPRGAIKLKHHGVMHAFLVSTSDGDADGGAPNPEGLRKLPSEPLRADDPEIASQSLATPIAQSSLAFSAIAPPASVSTSAPVSTALSIRRSPSVRVPPPIAVPLAPGQLLLGDNEPAQPARELNVAPSSKHTTPFPRAPPSCKSFASKGARSEAADSTSGGTGSSDMDEVFDGFLEMQNDEAAMDVFTTIRQAQMQAMQPESPTDGDPDGQGMFPQSTRPVAANAPKDPAPEVTPEQLAREISQFGKQLFLWMFRDRSLFAPYFKHRVHGMMPRIPQYYVLVSLMCVMMTIFHCILFGSEFYVVLIPRLAAFLPMNILCFLLARMRRTLSDGTRRLGLRPGVYTAAHIVYVVVISCVLHGQLVWLLSLSKTSDSSYPVLHMVFCTEIASAHQMTLSYYLSVHSLIFKYCVSAVNAVGPWIIFTLFNHPPDASIIVTLSAVWVTSVLACYLRERNGRESYLQLASMRKGFEAIKGENARFDRLLESALPGAILRKLQSNPAAVSQRIPEATVFFADIVKFTEFCAHVPSVFVVQMLDTLYARFDAICKEHHVTSIMTIGDCYFAGAGLVEPDDDQVSHCLRSAHEMIAETKRFNQEQGIELSLRIGLSTGVVFAGVLGVTRFTYDVWGPAVTKAKKLEAGSQANRVLTSAESFARLPQGALRHKRGPPIAQGNTYFVYPQSAASQHGSTRPTATARSTARTTRSLSKR